MNYLHYLFLRFINIERFYIAAIVLVNCTTVVNNCECEVSSLSITGKIQNIDEQNKYPLFYFPEILTQVVVCFDQTRGQMLFPLYFTKICSPMWYGKFRPGATCSRERIRGLSRHQKYYSQMDVVYNLAGAK